MHPRLRYSEHSKPVDTTPLKVDVIMIQQRPDDHAWVKEAKATVEQQCYPHLGFLVVNNERSPDREALTIGEAWNLAVAQSDADLVLFLGDDDGLCADLVTCMVESWKHMRKNAPNLVHLTTHCTVMDEEAGLVAQMAVTHTGMYLRQYLVDFPFNETLDRWVGRAKLNEVEQSQRFLGQPMSMGIVHYSGYIFRQHAWMVSGQRLRLK